MCVISMATSPLNVLKKDSSGNQVVWLRSKEKLWGRSMTKVHKTKMPRDIGEKEFSGTYKRWNNYKCGVLATRNCCSH